VSDADEDGKTALHLAAENGHIEAVAMLLEANASAATEDNYGLTAVRKAALGGHTNVALLLLGSSGSPCPYLDSASLIMNEDWESICASSAAHHVLLDIHQPEVSQHARSEFEEEPGPETLWWHRRSIPYKEIENTYDIKWEPRLGRGAYADVVEVHTIALESSLTNRLLIRGQKRSVTSISQTLRYRYTPSRS
jgi:ankyrin repeat protein